MLLQEVGQNVKNSTGIWVPGELGKTCHPGWGKQPTRPWLAELPSGLQGAPYHTWIQFLHLHSCLRETARSPWITPLVSHDLQVCLLDLAQTESSASPAGFQDTILWSHGPSPTLYLVLQYSEQMCASMLHHPKQGYPHPPFPVTAAPSTVPGEPMRRERELRTGVLRGAPFPLQGVRWAFETFLQLVILVHLAENERPGAVES